MWFLIKGAFWFSLVLVLLPIVGTGDPARSDTAPAVDVGDTVSAASEAFGYITALCLEKPDVCVKGTETFTALGHRAKEGARIAYQLLDTQFGEAGDPVTTGTVADGRKPAESPDTAIVPAPRPEPAATAEQDAGPVPSRIPVPEKRIEPRHNRAS